MTLCKKYPGKKKEEDLFLARESSILRLLKAGSKHFRSYAFRSAFFAHCLDTNVLKALMCARVAVPRWQRRVTGGVACCGAEPAVSLQNVQALEGEAFVAGHGCVTSGLIFEAHALEEPDSPLLIDELLLLERTNYPLAYTSKEVRSKLASLLLPQLHYHASFNQSEHWGDRNDGSLAESYPNAGDEDGLILLDLWVLPSDLEEDHPTAASWRLPLAYGIVPVVKGMGPVGQETALLSRRQYKAQVASAVRSTAVNGCDALLVACSTGLPGTSRGREVLSPEEAAEVWAEVLHGPKGGAPDRCFKQIVFCFGRGAGSSEWLRRTQRALMVAFEL